MYTYISSSIQILIVSDPALIHEVLVTKGADFAGRPLFSEFEAYSKNGHNIGMAQPDEKWKMMRKLGHSSIRQFDTGLERIENITMEMIDALIEQFNSHNGSAFDPKPYISAATLNIISQLIVGRIYKLDSEEIRFFNEVESTSFYLLSRRLAGAVMDTFPFIQPFYDFLKTARNNYDRVTNMYLTMIKAETKKSEEEGYYDSLASLVQKSVDKKDLTETHFRMMLTDILIAANSTTTNTLYGLLNVLVHHQDVQSKLHGEIDDVLGNRQASLKDRERMPYLLATIQEINRYSSIVPVSVAHSAVKDTHLDGKPVPAGTNLFTNLFALNHDENNFPEPFKFKPERFLDDNGDFVPADHPNRKNMNAFGAGPRVCFGETLAKSRMFLICANILQQFNIHGDENDLVSCDSRDYKFNQIAQPPKFCMRVTKREVCE